MENENFFHKNRCGVVTARLTLQTDNGARNLEFTGLHKAAVIELFEADAAAAADLAYDKKSLKIPVLFEVSYRLEEGKRPCLLIKETVRSGRKIMLETEEKHRYKRCGKELFYCGERSAKAPRKVKFLFQNT